MCVFMAGRCDTCPENESIYVCVSVWESKKEECTTDAGASDGRAPFCASCRLFVLSSPVCFGWRHRVRYTRVRVCVSPRRLSSFLVSCCVAALAASLVFLSLRSLTRTCRHDRCDELSAPESFPKTKWIAKVQLYKRGSLGGVRLFTLSDADGGAHCVMCACACMFVYLCRCLFVAKEGASSTLAPAHTYTGSALFRVCFCSPPPASPHPPRWAVSLFVFFFSPPSPLPSSHVTHKLG